MRSDTWLIELSFRCGDVGLLTCQWRVLKMVRHASLEAGWLHSVFKETGSQQTLGQLAILKPTQRLSGSDVAPTFGYSIS